MSSLLRKATSQHGDGHEKNWPAYLESITRADSIVAELWRKIQMDSVYRNTTSLFVTNDHGRHDDRHGGFQNHGDSCEGCRHIFMLALGPQFQPGRVIASPAYQVDIAVTAAELIGLRLPVLAGKSLLRRTR